MNQNEAKEREKLIQIIEEKVEQMDIEKLRRLMIICL